MKLEVFDKYTRVRVGMIKTYNYVSYTDPLRDQGKFSITIPTVEESLEYLSIGNYIWFEDNVFGIIKGISDVQDEDTEVTVYGFLLNHFLTYRSNLMVQKYNDKIGNIARSNFTDLFINPTDARRAINFFTIDSDDRDLTKYPKEITYQNTGKNFLDNISDLFEPYGLGFEMIPEFPSESQEEVWLAKLINIKLHIICPQDRSFGNLEGNVPIVFSFDLDNVLNLNYDEDHREYKTTAFVASEGVGQDRKTLEVGDSEVTGIDRIELYVDARDIQTDSDPEHPLTEEELLEMMEERGLQKLGDSSKYITFNVSVNTDSMRYKYGVDFYKGDYVSVIDKRMNKKIDVQITEITKTISRGIEHFDIKFGLDRIDILSKKERRLYNV